MSKTEFYLNEIKRDLDNIHDILFGGKATLEDLKEINEKLLALHHFLSEIHDLDASVNKAVRVSLQLLRIAFIILSMLMVCLIVMGSLNIFLGIGLSYLFYAISKAFKEYREKNMDSAITNILNELLEDVEYKQDSTLKKVVRLKKMQDLELKSSYSLDENLQIDGEHKQNQVRVLELKK